MKKFILDTIKRGNYVKVKLICNRFIIGNLSFTQNQFEEFVKQTKFKVNLK